MTLPDEKVFGEVQRLVENLIAMNEILRDRAAVSIRLVMTPDRMVIAEAMRTFTYLSLYGYLTDAVVVNRVFPEEVEGGYFGAWREVQREQLELVASGFAPVPVLRAPYFEQEVLGATMLDRLGASLFDGADAGAVLHDKLAQELSLNGDGASLGSTSRSPTRAHLAEEDRPRAGRARRRPQAHDPAAARARALPPSSRRRRTARCWCRSVTQSDPLSQMRSRSTRPTPPPTGSCARPSPLRASARARRCRRRGSRASAPSASGPRSPISPRWPGCRGPAPRCRRACAPARLGRARAADRAAGADRLVDRAPRARARGAGRGRGHPHRLVEPLASDVPVTSPTRCARCRRGRA